MENKDTKGLGFIASPGTIFIIKPVAKETSDAGIYLPPSERKKVDKDWLTVAAVGEDITRCKVGDKVLISAGSHSVVNIDDIDYLYVIPDYVIAVKAQY